MLVPFVDLHTQYETFSSEIDSAIKDVITRSSYILGQQVESFETSWASYIGTRHAIGVANGTDALELAFHSLGISAGDEVIIPAHTFVATAVAVIKCGATPVLVDIELDTYLIDPTQIEAAITPRTKAICPVHLYGRVCDMDTILAIAAKHKLFVVEDAAQAHGARWKGQIAGSFGDLGCFSFYPGKNLGAYGDGGAVVTNSDSLAQKLKNVRNYGSPRRYEYEEFGWNSRLDSIQAAVLSVKLKHLNEWNQQRWIVAKRYNELLLDVGFHAVLPQLMTTAHHVFHLYTVRVAGRDKLRAALKAGSVEAGVHYPRPFYLEPAYSFLGLSRGAFPVTEQVCVETLSLPLYPELNPTRQDLVVRLLFEAQQCAKEGDPRGN